MNAHALQVLGFAEVLDLVARHAKSELGAERVRSLRPMSDQREVATELERVTQTLDLLGKDPDWVPPSLPDARSAVARLAVEGGVLDPKELSRLGALLRAGRLLGDRLAGPVVELPHLVEVRSRLERDAGTEAVIARTVDDHGTVLDSASSELGSTRSELRRLQKRIVRRLEQYIDSLDDSFVVPDASISVRDGRYVVPIRREGMREVGGVIHGESATGATLFVEPPVAIQMMNEIRGLQEREEREIIRILTEFSERLRPSVDRLRGSQEALIDFDSLYARAQAARRWRASAPEIASRPEEGIRIVRGRHPLLLEKLGEDVVPFDLELEDSERVLVISGPNTGGKSVFLKSVGLIVILAQSGVFPPAGPGTRLRVFADVFADIGDEQSIADEVSTFSAHLRNLRQILESADESCLVLIDEMGTGTDPSEGGALSCAVLTELAARDVLSVVTSHLGDLKRLAGAEPGIVNGSLQFDSEGLRPTYRFQNGRPGRSYGLATARRLGLPDKILERAEGYLEGSELRVESLLGSLEQKESAAADLLDTVTREKDRLATLENQLRERSDALKAAERSADQRAQEEARRLLLEARKEVDIAIDEVRSAVQKGGDLEKVAREARRRVERAIIEHSAPHDRADVASTASSVLQVGDRVRLRAGTSTGTLVELEGDRAVVDVSGLRLKVSPSDLKALPSGKEDPRGGGRPSSGGSSFWLDSAVDPKTEVDLRGLRTDEVEGILLPALDQAVLGDLVELRVIHGMGTGAVRAKVEEVLSDDPRVEAFRLGGRGEGGTGVTIVTLR